MQSGGAGASAWQACAPIAGGGGEAGTQVKASGLALRDETRVERHLLGAASRVAAPSWTVL